jgi:hypothetical protein
VLLPLQFNDGRDVPADWLADAVLEIVQQFGAASYETQRIEGQWRQGPPFTATISCGSSLTCRTSQRTDAG